MRLYRPPVRHTKSFRFFTFSRESRQTILHCAHRVTTVSSWGLCEQEGWLPAPSHYSHRARSENKKDGLAAPFYPPEAARCASTGDHLARPLILLLRPILPLQKGVARLSFTARIERAPSERARSASKKDGLAAPSLPFYRIVVIVTPSPPSARSPARNSAT
jgi:hypothetical protein